MSVILSLGSKERDVLTKLMKVGFYSIQARSWVGRQVSIPPRNSEKSPYAERPDLPGQDLEQLD